MKRGLQRTWHLHINYGTAALRPVGPAVIRNLTMPW
jgi:hypothetical protein